LGTLLTHSKPAEALGFYRAALVGRPDSSEVYVRLGVVLAGLGYQEEALAAYRQAIQLDSNSPAAHSNLGAALHDKGQVEEALALCRRATQLAPDWAPSHYNLGICLQRKGQVGEAISEYHHALRLTPNWAEAHHQLGMCLEAQGRLADAMAEYRRAIQLHPKLAQPHYHLGVCWERQGQWDKAVAEYRHAIQLRPGLAEAKHRLGVALRKRRASDPLEQGRTHAARRDWAGAVACYARSVKRDPAEEGHYWFEYAAVLLLAGDRQGYARTCASLVERCGKDPNLRAYHVVRACTLASDSVTDLARPGRLAQAEFKVSPGKFSVLTEQGALHYRAGRFKEAVPLFERSLRADPKPGRAVLNWLWLALAHHRLGKPGEARRWLDKAHAWLDRYGAGMPPRAEEELGLHLHNWLEAHVLRREAEALLGPRAAKPK
jgi:tetratricopeptide (TPR) repeat protein